MAEWLLYEHDDGRHAVAPSAEAATFAHGDPKWHRVGPVEPLVPCPVCGGEAVHAQDVLARTFISLLVDMIGNYLLEHDFIKADNELFANISHAQGILCAVYQKIGAQHMSAPAVTL